MVHLKGIESPAYKIHQLDKDGIFFSDLDDFETHSNLSIDVQSGEGVVINLPSINAVPEPDVSWYVSGVPMSPQALKHQITLQNNLVLLSTSTQDNGKIYKAEVFNTYNGMSKSSNEFVLRVGGKLNH